MPATEAILRTDSACRPGTDPPACRDSMGPSVMGDPRPPELSGLSQALGRVPSGLYILTACRDGKATGMLASWVQQAGFDPPMVTVAVNRDRYVGDWIAHSGRFALNQVATG